MSESENKWMEFGLSNPMIGENIVCARIDVPSGKNEPAILEISAPFVMPSGGFLGDWTHWCPASVLPPVPAKRDYCREAFLNGTTYEPQAVGEVRRFYYPRLHPTCSSLVTYDEWVGIWSIAIACAKENGLEKV